MCVFCKIVNKELPASIVYEDDHVLCIQDLHPVAPVHVLIFPKQHFNDLIDMTNSDEGLRLSQSMFKAAAKVAEIKNAQSGFRLINNCGEDGGQTVGHVHFHLLGGKKLNEKIL